MFECIQVTSTIYYFKCIQKRKVKSQRITNKTEILLALQCSFNNTLIKICYDKDKFKELESFMKYFNKRLIR